jgi:hypothetical protein
MACGSEPAALSVGPVSFTERDLLGLSPDRRTELARLTAFGLAVADSSTSALGRPLIETWEEERLLEILAAELTVEEAGIEPEALEAYYLTDPEWELTVRHILFFSERWRPAEHRAEAEAKAGRALVALRQGADFAETAAALSEEPGAEGRQGLLTPGRAGSWVPEFWAAATALDPGDMSPVTETQYGYHILRLEDRAVVPFAEARSVVVRAVSEDVGDPAGVLEQWQAARGGGAAGREAALAEARSRGVTVPEQEQAALEREWDDMVYRWSATLGFRFGASPEQVAQAALAALAASGQGPTLVRAELSDYEVLLDQAYPVRTPTESG